MTISLHNYLYTFVIVSSWYIFKKLKSLSIQTTKVVLFVPFNNLLCSKSNSYDVNFKNVFKMCSNCIPKSNCKLKVLCNPHHFVEYPSTIHTIFLKDDDIQNLRVRSNLRRVYLTCVYAINQVQREG